MKGYGMSNVLISLLEQQLKDRIASDFEHTRMHVNNQLQGRRVNFFWIDPCDKDSSPKKIEGLISTAGFDAERNITVTISFRHPVDGHTLIVPRYLSELR